MLRGRFPRFALCVMCVTTAVPGCGSDSKPVRPDPNDVEAGAADIESRGGRATVFIGSLAGTHSPALSFSPMVGAELSVDGGGELWTDLDPRFEHALFVLDGAAALEGEDLAPDILYYLAPGRADFRRPSHDPKIWRTGRLLLVVGDDTHLGVERQRPDGAGIAVLVGLERPDNRHGVVVLSVVVGGENQVICRL